MKKDVVKVWTKNPRQQENTVKDLDARPATMLGIKHSWKAYLKIQTRNPQQRLKNTIETSNGHS